MLGDILTHIIPMSYSASLAKVVVENGLKNSRPCQQSGCVATIAVYIDTTIVVAGGWGEGGVLSTVEVMNTKNHQWSTVADLPQPVY